MKTGILGLTLWICAAVLGGCATIVDGTTQEMSFQSSPEGVVVMLIRAVPVGDYWAEEAAKDAGKTVSTHDESRILGKTPFTVQLDRAEGQSIVFSKEGYKSLPLKLTTVTNGTFWGNILLGGLVGSTTDSISGAIYEYVPSQYFVTLNPEFTAPIEQGTGQAQHDKALAFIVRRHSAILATLSQGGGEDWTALMSLLSIGPGHEAEARQKIRALALVYPNTADFATHVTDLYLK